MSPLVSPAEGDEPVLDEDVVAAQNFAQRMEEAKRAKAEQETRERIAKYVLPPNHWNHC